MQVRPVSKNPLLNKYHLSRNQGNETYLDYQKNVFFEISANQKVKFVSKMATSEIGQNVCFVCVCACIQDEA